MNNRTHSPTHELLTAGGSFVFVQMDQPTIADYPVGVAASTPTYRYVYASYIDEPVVRKTASTGGTRVYFHRNQQYSITAVTTSTGSIAERYAYSAYGQPTILDASASVLSNSAINNRYTYSGREWDATLGLHHFRARWMSPNAGRFLGRDPIGYIRDLDNSKRYIDLLVTRGLVDFRLNIFEFLNSKSLDSLDPHGAMTIWPPWLNPFKWWGGYKACEDVSNLYDCAYYQPIWNNYKEECEDEMNQDYIVFMLTSERDCPHQLYPIFGPRSTEQAVFCCMFKKAKAAGLDVKKFANSATACIAGIRLPFTITSLLIPALE